MSSMADPMDALLEIQQALNAKTPFDVPELDEGYKTWSIENSIGKRHVFAKIINGEIQALSIFGLVDPIDGIECWAVGYAVSERHRRRGLAVEAFRKGLEELKRDLSQSKVKRFYVEAVIDVGNSPSIRLAEKLFLCTGEKTIDGESGRPALWFKRLIVTE